jgi:hypothetical protein
MREGDGEQAAACYGAATTEENQENADPEEAGSDKAPLLSDTPKHTVVGLDLMNQVFLTPRHICLKHFAIQFVRIVLLYLSV